MFFIDSGVVRCIANLCQFVYLAACIELLGIFADILLFLVLLV